MRAVLGWKQAEQMRYNLDFEQKLFARQLTPHPFDPTTEQRRNPKWHISPFKAP